MSKGFLEFSCEVELLDVDLCYVVGDGELLDYFFVE